MITPVRVSKKPRAVHPAGVVLFLVVAVLGCFSGLFPEDQLRSFLFPCLGPFAKGTPWASPPSKREPCTHPCAPYRRCGCRSCMKMAAGPAQSQ